MSAELNAEKAQEGIHTKRLGQRIFYAREVSSTNDWAKELAELGAEEGTVVLAETQKAGRGRLGREWGSPKGGLWFSVILRPRLQASEAIGLTFAAGLTVAEVLSEVCRLPVETKWPNDVLVHGKKVCGILCETSTRGKMASFVVVGIGINVNFDIEKTLPRSLRDSATSIQDELGKKVQIEELLRHLLERLETLYDLYLKEGLAPVLEKWKEYTHFLGSHVRIENGTETLWGQACDVDSEGALAIRLESGSCKRFFAGDVVLTRKS